MLLYNVATGLYTSIMRVLIAILLTLLVKPRLDRIVFIAPFQRFDTGNMMKTVDIYIYIYRLLPDPFPCLQWMGLATSVFFLVN